MAKVTYRGFAKPDDPIYASGLVIGGVRFYNPPKDQLPKDDRNSLRVAIDAITPEQAEENDRYCARLRAEAVAKGQDPMQPYADAMEEAILRTVECEEIVKLFWDGPHDKG